MADWLTDHDIESGWDVAPTLVAAGLGVDWLEELVTVTPPPHLEYGLSYPVRAIESDNLLDEITDGVERISGLLASAEQSRRWIGRRCRRSTCTTVDPTMTMLSHKIGYDVEVIREYNRRLPRMVA